MEDALPLYWRAQAVFLAQQNLSKALSAKDVEVKFALCPSECRFRAGPIHAGNGFAVSVYEMQFRPCDYSRPLAQKLSQECQKRPCSGSVST